MMIDKSSYPRMRSSQSRAGQRDNAARAMDKSRGRTIRRHFIEERRRHIAAALMEKRSDEEKE